MAIKIKAFTKDPAAVLDYAWDWNAETNGNSTTSGDWLASGETITSHSVTSEPGLTVDSSGESAGIVTAWLSGGTAGEDYLVTCQVVTDGGRTDERDIKIECRNR